MTDVPTERVMEPCPFCGEAEALVVSAYDVQPDDYHGAQVRCGNCDALGADGISLDGWLSSKAEATAAAIAAWNRRAPSSELLALREAVKPSAETKAAYMGEFHIAVERIVNEDDEADDEGDVDPYEHIQVPWTTIKQIMAAIAARALQSHSTGDDK